MTRILAITLVSLVTPLGFKSLDRWTPLEWALAILLIVAAYAVRRTTIVRGW